ncbi:putative PPPDE peptidase domain-containing protein [Dioscorea sansibarensis]
MKEVGNGEGDSGRTTHLYLNVYDLTTMNNYLYWFGLGIFHSGIEAYGMEYAFGAHDYPTSGVFEVEPKSCPGFIYRRTMWLGSTNMSRSEFRLFIEDLAVNYHGDTYHLISKNCNHFTDDVCRRLLGKPIPGWVNRLARLGSFCNCLFPETIPGTSLEHLANHPENSDDGSESVVSLVMEDSDEEGSEHHLLKLPSIDQVYLEDKPLRLARDML